MSALSITFHFTEAKIHEWNNNLLHSLESLIKDSLHIKNFIISEVHTEYLNEGKNYNVLLFFDDLSERENFMGGQLASLDQEIEQQFGNEIMLFVTPLNKISSSFK
jgi:hypothetical protein